MLRSRGNPDPLGAGEGGNLDGGAADRLDDRDRDVDFQVVAAAAEDRRLAHARYRVEVARRPTAAPGFSLPGQPHPAAVANAGRDVDLVALDLARLPAAAASRARVLDLGAGPAALGAGMRDREEALALADDAAALAARAHRRRRSGLRARAAAGRAGRRDRHGDRHLRALHRLVERNVDLGLEVAAALRPVARAPPGAGRAGAEQVGEDVPDPAEAAESGCARPERARVEAAEDPATRVVLLALLGVGQDRVGLLDLLEPLLGALVALVAVGVVLARELAVGLLDLVLGGLLVDAEDLVGILDGGHYALTTTRAGRITVSPRR